MVWPSEPLGQLCDVQIGRTPTRAEARFWGEEHPWLSISDMNQGRELETTSERVTQTAVDELNLRLVAPGTVLLSFKLSIGKIGIACRPMYTNEAIAHLPIVDDRIERDYLYWALRTVPLAAEADRAALGATLNKAKLEKIPIPLPPIEEQRRIAAVLDAAEGLRDKRRHVIAKLETLTQAIFIEMFGDRGLWTVDKLGDHVPTTSGGTPSRSRTEYFGGPVPWVKSGELASGNVTKTEESITEEGVANSSAKLMPPGTVSARDVRRDRRRGCDPGHRGCHESSHLLPLTYRRGERAVLGWVPQIDEG